MKVRINISISEEANNILNKQPNKSGYLEDLILGNVKSPAVVSNTLEAFRNILREELKTPHSQTPNSSVSPKQKKQNSSVPDPIEKLKNLIPGIYTAADMNKKIDERGLCKRCGSILATNGKCLMKGCKK